MIPRGLAVPNLTWRYRLLFPDRLRTNLSAYLRWDKNKTETRSFLAWPTMKHASSGLSEPRFFRVKQRRIDATIKRYALFCEARGTNRSSKLCFRLWGSIAPSHPIENLDR
jgi:hypothetical protein